MHYGAYGTVKCRKIINFMWKFFSVQKGGPPKIGGPVRPNSSNMPKAGPGSRDSMLQTSVPIVRYGTYRFYRKLLEPPVVRQLLNNELFEDRWSLTKNTVGFRAGHSTETAVLCVLSDILHTVGHGDVAALVFWTYQPLLIRLTMISCCESTYVFLRFLRFFFKIQEKRDFLRFLEWLTTFSRTLPVVTGAIEAGAAGLWKRVWNTLSEETTSSPSLTIFCQRLKTWLVRQCHPYLIIWPGISLNYIYTNCLTLKYSSAT